MAIGLTAIVDTVISRWRRRLDKLAGDAWSPRSPSSACRGLLGGIWSSQSLGTGRYCCRSLVSCHCSASHSPGEKVHDCLFRFRSNLCAFLSGSSLCVSRFKSSVSRLKLDSSNCVLCVYNQRIKCWSFEGRDLEQDVVCL